MFKRSYPKKFQDNLTCAGRSYSRWGLTGTFNTTDDVKDPEGFFGKSDWYVDADDIVRWDSNDRVPFGDVLLDFCEALMITPKQLRKSNEEREQRTSEFWQLGEWVSYIDEEGEEAVRFVPGKAS